MGKVCCSGVAVDSGDRGNCDSVDGKRLYDLAWGLQPGRARIICARDRVQVCMYVAIGVILPASVPCPSLRRTALGTQWGPQASGETRPSDCATDTVSQELWEAVISWLCERSPGAGLCRCQPEGGDLGSLSDCCALAGWDGRVSGRDCDPGLAP